MTRPNPFAKGNKFRAKRTVVDGVAFDSKREAARHAELRLLERAGKIEKLEIHPRYKLEAFSPRGTGAVLIGHYTADFAYVEDGQKVTEDVKSPITKAQPDYRLRVKLFRANYPEIQFREVM